MFGNSQCPDPLFKPATGLSRSITIWTLPKDLPEKITTAITKLVSCAEEEGFSVFQRKLSFSVNPEWEVHRVIVASDSSLVDSETEWRVQMLEFAAADDHDIVFRYKEIRPRKLFN